MVLGFFLILCTTLAHLEIFDCFTIVFGIKIYFNGINKYMRNTCSKFVEDKMNGTINSVCINPSKMIDIHGHVIFGHVKTILNRKLLNILNTLIF